MTDRVTVLSQTHCRVGVWGFLDLDTYGPMVEALITRQELVRRLPAADVRLFAPFGHLRPCRLDAGEAVEPLGDWDERRLDSLADELDCVVIAGGRSIGTSADFAATYGLDPAGVDDSAGFRFLVDGLGPARETECPVVRPTVGLDEPADVGPDATVLLPRLFPAEVLDKRLDYLRLMGWYPDAPGAIVVQGSAEMGGWVPELAASLGDLLHQDSTLAVVVAELGSSEGDAGFAAALLDALAGTDRVFHLPPVGSADVATAIAGSRGFVGSSRAGIVTALAYERPIVMLGPDEGLADLAGQAGQADGPALEPSALAKLVAGLLEQVPQPETLSLLRKRADAHFDRVAEIAAGAARRRDHEGSSSRSTDDRMAALEERVAALQQAWRARGEQLFAERAVCADRIAVLTHEAQRWRTQLFHEVPRRMAAEAETEAIRGTRTFRWTAQVRSAYARLRPPPR